MATDEDINEMFGEEETPEPVKTTEGESADPVDPGVKPEDSATPAEEAPEPTPEEVAAARITELEKMNNGLLQAKTSAMQKVDKSGESLASANERIKALEEQVKIQQVPKPDPVEDKPIENVKVEYDEEGNAFIKAENLPVDKSNAKKVAELETRLEQATTDLATSTLERKQAEYTQSFLNEKEGYKEAFVEVKEQWDYIKGELFNQFIVSQDIKPPTTQAEALEISANPEFQKAFKAKYPTGDVESIMQAGLYQNKYYEKKALETVLAQKVPKSTHKQLPDDKPLPLASVPGSNQAQEEDSLDKFANMDMEDFLRMSSEDEIRMNRLLENRG